MIEILRKFVKDNPRENYYSRKLLKHKELFNWVKNQLPEIDSVNEKIFLLLNEKPGCPHGFDRKFISNSKGYGYCGRADTCRCLKALCSTTSVPLTTEKKEEIANKRRETSLSRYGVDNPSKHVDIKDKKRQTSIKNWGVDNPMQSVDIVGRLQETNLERYGVDNAAKLPETIRKAEQTKLEKYGDSYFQFRKHIPAGSLMLLDDTEWLLNENKTKTPLQIANHLGLSSSAIYKKFESLGVDYLRHPSVSVPENEILEYVRSILGDIEVEQSNRRICYPKEIDIYIPSRNLAIEYNGIFMHSESRGKHKTYHLEKTEQCKKQGIRLIHVFGNEWEEQQPIVKSRISSLLGSNRSVYARKTCIRNVSVNDERVFLNTNHIQGYVRSDNCLGLYHNDALVAVMSFCKSRFNKEYQFELLRYASLCDVNVVGGASKLFKYFVNNFRPASVISYSDLRWNTGNLYKMLDFQFLHVAPPNYFYTKDYHRLFSRQAFQKHKLPKLLENFDPVLSEWQNMQNHGYDRIWDCGNSVWGWTFDK